MPDKNNVVTASLKDLLAAWKQLPSKHRAEFDGETWTVWTGHNDNDWPSRSNLSPEVFKQLVIKDLILYREDQTILAQRHLHEVRRINVLVGENVQSS